jgi:hypothetical protein
MITVLAGITATVAQQQEQCRVLFVFIESDYCVGERSWLMTTSKKVRSLGCPADCRETGDNSKERAIDADARRHVQGAGEDAHQEHNEVLTDSEMDAQSIEDEMDKHR